MDWNCVAQTFLWEPETVLKKLKKPNFHLRVTREQLSLLVCTNYRVLKSRTFLFKVGECTIMKHNQLKNLGELCNTLALFSWPRSRNHILWVTIQTMQRAESALEPHFGRPWIRKSGNIITFDRCFKLNILHAKGFSGVKIRLLLCTNFQASSPSRFGLISTVK